MPDRVIPLGKGRVYNPNAKDLLIVTFRNGELIAKHAKDCGKVLV